MTMRETSPGRRMPPAGCSMRAAVQGRPGRGLLARQRGQVLVWFLGFAATLAVVFAGVFSVGQVTSEKQKVVNAADTAAYSGALVEARALNLVAYTNRSVIANEVLIAQVISLQSWTDYFERATSNYKTVLDVLATVTVEVPPLAAAIKALSAVMQVLNKAVTVQQKAVNAAVPTVIRTWEGLYTLWYDTVIVSAFVPPTMALAAKAASTSVLQQNVATQGGRNDSAPRLIETTALMLNNEYEWGRATKRYSGNDRKYAKELLLASRDDFSTNRPGTDLPFLKVLFGNSSICVPFVFKIGSEKQGPTRLVGYDRWEAQDTLEFKQKIGPVGCGWGKGTMAEPIGWGRSVANRRGNTKGTRINTEGGAGTLAWNATNKNGGWTGVKSLYDVERDNAGKPKVDPDGFTYAIAVAKDKGQIRNNEALGFESRSMTGPVGSPDLKAGFVKDQMISLAEARIFFARPVRNSRDITAGNLFRADSHQEYASLYNPYWQVRLSKPSDVTKAAVYGVAGINPALEVFAQ